MRVLRLDALDAVLDARHRAQLVLEVRVRDDELRDQRAQPDHARQPHAQRGGVCRGAQLRRQRDQQRREAADEQVEHKVQPALDQEHHVDGSLGRVDTTFAGALVLGLPAEGADGREAVFRFGESGVYGGLELDVENAELLGREEVEAREDPQRGEGGRDGGGHVLGPASGEGNLAEGHQRD